MPCIVAPETQGRTHLRHPPGCEPPPWVKTWKEERGEREGRREKDREMQTKWSGNDLWRKGKVRTHENKRWMKEEKEEGRKNLFKSLEMIKTNYDPFHCLAEEHWLDEDRGERKRQKHN